MTNAAAHGWICLTQAAGGLDPRRRVYLNVHAIAGCRPGNGFGEHGGACVWQIGDDTLWSVEESPAQVMARIATALAPVPAEP